MNINTAFLLEEWRAEGKVNMILIYLPLGHPVATRQAF